MSFNNQALHSVCEIFETHNIPYWICNGTLLGVVRDSELIPWDEDLDFGIMKEYSQAVREIFQKFQFEVLNDGSGSNYLLLAFKDKENSIKIDINFYEQVGNSLVTLWRVPRIGQFVAIFRKIVEKLGLNPSRCGFFFELSGYKSLVKDVFPTKTIMFQNRNVSIPYDAEACLIHTYGEDWKIPKRDYNWRSDGSNLATRKNVKL